MTIKEALGRITQEENKTERLILPESNSDRDSEYVTMQFELGRNILEESNSLRYLEELKDMVRLETKGPLMVVDSGMLEEDGTLQAHLLWNPASTDDDSALWNSITISARPLTQDIVVIGYERELLPQYEWRNNPEQFENVLARAYLRPGLKIWPPRQMTRK